MKKLITISLLAFLMNCEKEPKKIERVGNPDVVYFENTDQEMNVAVETAKKTLPEFKKALESNNPNYSSFVLKQEFEAANGGGEHIWITDIQLKDGKYFGIIDNVPVDPMIKVKLGDTVEVANDKISDWKYNDKNVVKGAYTVKVIRKHMSPEEKRQMDAGGLIYE